MCYVREFSALIVVAGFCFVALLSFQRPKLSLETDEQSQRQIQLRNFCSKHNLKTSKSAFSFSLIKKQKNVSYAYCSLPKSGSSSIRRILHRASPMSPSKQNIWSGIDSARKRNIFNRTRGSFFFVRHPFTRLVSCYREKILARNWGRQAKVVTTFRNFIVYNLHKDKMANRHFDPAWKQCDVCNVHYDVIGKVETFDEDIKSVFKITGLNRTDFKSKVRSTKHLKKMTSDEEAKEIFRNRLPQRLVQILYAKYRFDFEAFNYEPWGLLNDG